MSNMANIFKFHSSFKANFSTQDQASKCKKLSFVCEKTFLIEDYLSEN